MIDETRKAERELDQLIESEARRMERKQMTTAAASAPLAAPKAPAKTKRLPNGFWTKGLGHTAALVVARDASRLKAAAARLAPQMGWDLATMERQLSFYADQARRLAVS